MNRLTISIFALIFSIFCVNAQKNADAEKLITDLLVSAKSNAIKTNFKLTFFEKNAVNSQSSSGTFIIKGNKFVLEMSDMKVWFDGKTQWSYLKNNNEVSISEPTEKELGETNPMAILSGFRNKSTIRFSKSKSTQNHIIEMIPKTKNKDFSKVEVLINKTNGHLVSIKLNADNGSGSILSLTNFQKGISTTENLFVFDKSKFKGVMINDLR